jgi:hypothetical protein
LRQFDSRMMFDERYKHQWSNAAFNAAIIYVGKQGKEITWEEFLELMDDAIAARAAWRAKNPVGFDARYAALVGDGP